MEHPPITPTKLIGAGVLHSVATSLGTASNATSPVSVVDKSHDDKSSFASKRDVRPDWHASGQSEVGLCDTNKYDSVEVGCAYSSAVPSLNSGSIALSKLLRFWPGDVRFGLPGYIQYTPSRFCLIYIRSLNLRLGRATVSTPQHVFTAPLSVLRVNPYFSPLSVYSSHLSPLLAPGDCGSVEKEPPVRSPPAESIPSTGTRRLSQESSASDYNTLYRMPEQLDHSCFEKEPLSYTIQHGHVTTDNVVEPCYRESSYFLSELYQRIESIYAREKSKFTARWRQSLIAVPVDDKAEITMLQREYALGITAFNNKYRGTITSAMPTFTDLFIQPSFSVVDYTAQHSPSHTQGEKPVAENSRAAINLLEDVRCISTDPVRELSSAVQVCSSVPDNNAGDVRQQDLLAPEHLVSSPIRQTSQQLIAASDSNEVSVPDDCEDQQPSAQYAVHNKLAPRRSTSIPVFITSPGTKDLLMTRTHHGLFGTRASVLSKVLPSKREAKCRNDASSESFSPCSAIDFSSQEDLPPQTLMQKSYASLLLEARETKLQAFKEAARAKKRAQMMIAGRQAVSFLSDFGMGGFSENSSCSETHYLDEQPGPVSANASGAAVQESMCSIDSCACNDGKLERLHRCNIRDRALLFLHTHAGRAARRRPVSPVTEEDLQIARGLMLTRSYGTIRSPVKQKARDFTPCNNTEAIAYDPTAIEADMQKDSTSSDPFYHLRLSVNIGASCNPAHSSLSLHGVDSSLLGEHASSIEKKAVETAASIEKFKHYALRSFELNKAISVMRGRQMTPLHNLSALAADSSLDCKPEWQKPNCAVNHSLSLCREVSGRFQTAHAAINRSLFINMQISCAIQKIITLIDSGLDAVVVTVDSLAEVTPQKMVLDVEDFLEAVAITFDYNELAAIRLKLLNILLVFQTCSTSTIFRHLHSLSHTRESRAFFLPETPSESDCEHEIEDEGHDVRDSAPYDDWPSVLLKAHSEMLSSEQLKSLRQNLRNFPQYFAQLVEHTSCTTGFEGVNLLLYTEISYLVIQEVLPLLCCLACKDVIRTLNYELLCIPKYSLLNIYRIILFVVKAHIERHLESVIRSWAGHLERMHTKIRLGILFSETEVMYSALDEYDILDTNKCATSLSDRPFTLPTRVQRLGYEAVLPEDDTQRDPLLKFSYFISKREHCSPATQISVDPEPEWTRPAVLQFFYQHAERPLRLRLALKDCLDYLSAGAAASDNKAFPVTTMWSLPDEAWHEFVQNVSNSLTVATCSSSSVSFFYGLTDSVCDSVRGTMRIVSNEYKGFALSAIADSLIDLNTIDLSHYTAEPYNLPPAFVCKTSITLEKGYYESLRETNCDASTYIQQKILAVEATRSATLTEQANASAASDTSSGHPVTLDSFASSFEHLPARKGAISSFTATNSNANHDDFGTAPEMVTAEQTAFLTAVPLDPAPAIPSALTFDEERITSFYVGPTYSHIDCLTKDINEGAAHLMNIYSISSEEVSVASAAERASYPSMVTAAVCGPDFFVSLVQDASRIIDTLDGHLKELLSIPAVFCSAYSVLRLGCLKTDLINYLLDIRKRIQEHIRSTVCSLTRFSLKVMTETENVLRIRCRTPEDLSNLQARMASQKVFVDAWRPVVCYFIDQLEFLAPILSNPWAIIGAVSHKTAEDTDFYGFEDDKYHVQAVMDANNGFVCTKQQYKNRHSRKEKRIRNDIIARLALKLRDPSVFGDTHLPRSLRILFLSEAKCRRSREHKPHLWGTDAEATVKIQSRDNANSPHTPIVPPLRQLLQHDESADAGAVEEDSRGWQVRNTDGPSHNVQMPGRDMLALLQDDADGTTNEMLMEFIGKLLSVHSLQRTTLDETQRLTRFFSRFTLRFFNWLNATSFLLSRHVADVSRLSTQDLYEAKFVPRLFHANYCSICEDLELEFLDDYIDMAGDDPTTTDFLALVQSKTAITLSREYLLSRSQAQAHQADTYASNKRGETSINEVAHEASHYIETSVVSMKRYIPDSDCATSISDCALAYPDVGADNLQRSRLIPTFPTPSETDGQASEPSTLHRSIDGECSTHQQNTGFLYPRQFHDESLRWPHQYIRPLFQGLVETPIGYTRPSSKDLNNPCIFAASLSDVADTIASSQSHDASTNKTVPSKNRERETFRSRQRIISDSTRKNRVTAPDAPTTASRSRQNNIENSVPGHSLDTFSHLSEASHSLAPPCTAYSVLALPNGDPSAEQLVSRNQRRVSVNLGLQRMHAIADAATSCKAIPHDKEAPFLHGSTTNSVRQSDLPASPDSRTGEITAARCKLLSRQPQYSLPFHSGSDQNGHARNIIGATPENKTILMSPAPKRNMRRIEQPLNNSLLPCPYNSVSPSFESEVPLLQGIGSAIASFSVDDIQSITQDTPQSNQCFNVSRILQELFFVLSEVSKLHDFATAWARILNITHNAYCDPHVALVTVEPIAEILISLYTLQHLYTSTMNANLCSVPVDDFLAMLEAATTSIYRIRSGNHHENWRDIASMAEKVVSDIGPKILLLYFLNSPSLAASDVSTFVLKYLGTSESTRAVLCREVVEIPRIQRAFLDAAGMYHRGLANAGAIAQLQAIAKWLRRCRINAFIMVLDVDMNVELAHLFFKWSNDVRNSRRDDVECAFQPSDEDSSIDGAECSGSPVSRARISTSRPHNVSNMIQTSRQTFLERSPRRQLHVREKHDRSTKDQSDHLEALSMALSPLKYDVPADKHAFSRSSIMVRGIQNSRKAAPTGKKTQRTTRSDRLLMSSLQTAIPVVSCSAKTLYSLHEALYATESILARTSADETAKAARELENNITQALFLASIAARLQMIVPEILFLFVELCRPTAAIYVELSNQLTNVYEIKKNILSFLNTVRELSISCLRYQHNLLRVAVGRRNLCKQLARGITTISSILATACSALQRSPMYAFGNAFAPESMLLPKIPSVYFATGEVYELAFAMSVPSVKEIVLGSPDREYSFVKSSLGEYRIGGYKSGFERLNFEYSLPIPPSLRSFCASSATLSARFNSLADALSYCCFLMSERSYSDLCNTLFYSGVYFAISSLVFLHLDGSWEKPCVLYYSILPRISAIVRKLNKVILRQNITRFQTANYSTEMLYRDTFYYLNAILARVCEYSALLETMLVHALCHCEALRDPTASAEQNWVCANKTVRSYKATRDILRRFWTPDNLARIRALGLDLSTFASRFAGTCAYCVPSADIYAYGFADQRLQYSLCKEKIARPTSSIPSATISSAAAKIGIYIRDAVYPYAGEYTGKATARDLVPLSSAQLAVVASIIESTQLHIPAILCMSKEFGYCREDLTIYATAVARTLGCLYRFVHLTGGNPPDMWIRRILALVLSGHIVYLCGAEFMGMHFYSKLASAMYSLRFKRGDLPCICTLNAAPVKLSDDALPKRQGNVVIYLPEVLHTGSEEVALSRRGKVVLDVLAPHIQIRVPYYSIASCMNSASQVLRGFLTGQKSDSMNHQQTTSSAQATIASEPIISSSEVPLLTYSAMFPHIDISSTNQSTDIRDSFHYVCPTFTLELTEIFLALSSKNITTPHLLPGDVVYILELASSPDKALAVSSALLMFLVLQTSDLAIRDECLRIVPTSFGVPAHVVPSLKRILQAVSTFQLLTPATSGLHAAMCALSVQETGDSLNMTSHQILWGMLEGIFNSRFLTLCDTMATQDSLLEPFGVLNAVLLIDFLKSGPAFIAESSNDSELLTLFVHSMASIGKYVIFWIADLCDLHSQLQNIRNCGSHALLIMLYCGINSSMTASILPLITALQSGSPSIFLDNDTTLSFDADNMPRLLVVLSNSVHKQELTCTQLSHLTHGIVLAPTYFSAHSLCSRFVLKQFNVHSPSTVFRGMIRRILGCRLEDVHSYASCQVYLYKKCEQLTLDRKKYLLQCAERLRFASFLWFFSALYFLEELSTRIFQIPFDSYLWRVCCGLLMKNLQMYDIVSLGYEDTGLHDWASRKADVQRTREIAGKTRHFSVHPDLPPSMPLGSVSLGAYTDKHLQRYLKATFSVEYVSNYLFHAPDYKAVCFHVLAPLFLAAFNSISLLNKCFPSRSIKHQVELWMKSVDAFFNRGGIIGFVRSRLTPEEFDNIDEAVCGLSRACDLLARKLPDKLCAANNRADCCYIAMEYSVLPSATGGASSTKNASFHAEELVSNDHSTVSHQEDGQSGPNTQPMVPAAISNEQCSDRLHSQVFNLSRTQAASPEEALTRRGAVPSDPDRLLPMRYTQQVLEDLACSASKDISPVCQFSDDGISKHRDDLDRDATESIGAYAHDLDLFHFVGSVYALGHGCLVSASLETYTRTTDVLRLATVFTNDLLCYILYVGTAFLMRVPVCVSGLPFTGKTTLITAASLLVHDFLDVQQFLLYDADSEAEVLGSIVQSLRLCILDNAPTLASPSSKLRLYHVNCMAMGSDVVAERMQSPFYHRFPDDTLSSKNPSTDSHSTNVEHSAVYSKGTSRLTLAVQYGYYSLDTSKDPHIAPSSLQNLAVHGSLSAPNVAFVIEQSSVRDALLAKACLPVFVPPLTNEFYYRVFKESFVPLSERPPTPIGGLLHDSSDHKEDTDILPCFRMRRSFLQEFIRGLRLVEHILPVSLLRVAAAMKRMTIFTDASGTTDVQLCTVSLPLLFAALLHIPEIHMGHIAGLRDELTTALLLQKLSVSGPFGVLVSENVDAYLAANAGLAKSAYAGIQLRPMWEYGILRYSYEKSHFNQQVSLRHFTDYVLQSYSMRLPGQLEENIETGRTVSQALRKQPFSRLSSSSAGKVLDETICSSEQDTMAMSFFAAGQKFQSCLTYNFRKGVISSQLFELYTEVYKKYIDGFLDPTLCNRLFHLHILLSMAAEQNSVHVFLFLKMRRSPGAFRSRYGEGQFQLYETLRLRVPLLAFSCTHMSNVPYSSIVQLLSSYGGYTVLVSKYTPRAIALLQRRESSSSNARAISSGNAVDVNASDDPAPDIIMQSFAEARKTPELQAFLAAQDTVEANCIRCEKRIAVDFQALIRIVTNSSEDIMTKDLDRTDILEDYIACLASTLLTQPEHLAPHYIMRAIILLCLGLHPSLSLRNLGMLSMAFGGLTSSISQAISEDIIAQLQTDLGVTEISSLFIVKPYNILLILPMTLLGDPASSTFARSISSLSLSKYNSLPFFTTAEAATLGVLLASLYEVPDSFVPAHTITLLSRALCICVLNDRASFPDYHIPYSSFARSTVIEDDLNLSLMYRQKRKLSGYAFSVSDTALPDRFLLRRIPLFIIQNMRLNVSVKDFDRLSAYKKNKAFCDSVAKKLSLYDADPDVLLFGESMDPLSLLYRENLHDILLEYFSKLIVLVYNFCSSRCVDGSIFYTFTRFAEVSTAILEQKLRLHTGFLRNVYRIRSAVDTLMHPLEHNSLGPVVRYNTIMLCRHLLWLLSALRDDFWACIATLQRSFCDSVLIAARLMFYPLIADDLRDEGAFEDSLYGLLKGDMFDESSLHSDPNAGHVRLLRCVYQKHAYGLPTAAPVASSCERLYLPSKLAVLALDIVQPVWDIRQVGVVTHATPQILQDILLIMLAQMLGFNFLLVAPGIHKILLPLLELFLFRKSLRDIQESGHFDSEALRRINILCTKDTGGNIVNDKLYSMSTVRQTLLFYIDCASTADSFNSALLKGMHRGTAIVFLNIGSPRAVSTNLTALRNIKRIIQRKISKKNEFIQISAQVGITPPIPLHEYHMYYVLGTDSSLASLFENGSLSRQLMDYSMFFGHSSPILGANCSVLQTRSVSMTKLAYQRTIHSLSDIYFHQFIGVKADCENLCFRSLNRAITERYCLYKKAHKISCLLNSNLLSNKELCRLLRAPPADPRKCIPVSFLEEYPSENLMTFHASSVACFDTSFVEGEVDMPLLSGIDVSLLQGPIDPPLEASVVYTASLPRHPLSEHTSPLATNDNSSTDRLSNAEEDPPAEIPLSTDLTTIFTFIECIKSVALERKRFSSTGQSHAEIYKQAERFSAFALSALLFVTRLCNMLPHAALALTDHFLADIWPNISGVSAITPQTTMDLVLSFVQAFCYGLLKLVPSGMHNPVAGILGALFCTAFGLGSVEDLALLKFIQPNSLSTIVLLHQSMNKHLNTVDVPWSFFESPMVLLSWRVFHSAGFLSKGLMAEWSLFFRHDSTLFSRFAMAQNPYAIMLGHYYCHERLTSKKIPLSSPSNRPPLVSQTSPPDYVPYDSLGLVTQDGTAQMSNTNVVPDKFKQLFPHLCERTVSLPSSLANSSYSNAWRSLLFAISCNVGSTAACFELFNRMTYTTSVFDRLAAEASAAEDNRLYMAKNLHIPPELMSDISVRICSVSIHAAGYTQNPKLYGSRKAIAEKHANDAQLAARSNSLQTSPAIKALTTPLVVPSTGFGSRTVLLLYDVIYLPEEWIISCLSRELEYTLHLPKETVQLLPDEDALASRVVIVPCRSNQEAILGNLIEYFHKGYRPGHLLYVLVPLVSRVSLENITTQEIGNPSGSTSSLLSHLVDIAKPAVLQLNKPTSLVSALQHAYSFLESCRALSELSADELSPLFQRLLHAIVLDTALRSLPQSAASAFSMLVPLLRFTHQTATFDKVSDVRSAFIAKAARLQGPPINADYSVSTNPSSRCNTMEFLSVAPSRVAAGGEMFKTSIFDDAASRAGRSLGPCPFGAVQEAAVGFLPDAWPFDTTGATGVASRRYAASMHNILLSAYYGTASPLDVQIVMSHVTCNSTVTRVLSRVLQETRQVEGRPEPHPLQRMRPRVANVRAASEESEPSTLLHATHQSFSDSSDARDAYRDIASSTGNASSPQNASVFPPDASNNLATDAVSFSLDDTSIESHFRTHDLFRTFTTKELCDLLPSSRALLRIPKNGQANKTILIPQDSSSSTLDALARSTTALSLTANKFLEKYSLHTAIQGAVNALPVLGLALHPLAFADQSFRLSNVLYRDILSILLSKDILSVLRTVSNRGNLQQPNSSQATKEDDMTTEYVNPYTDSELWMCERLQSQRLMSCLRLSHGATSINRSALSLAGQTGTVSDMPLTTGSCDCVVRGDIYEHILLDLVEYYRYVFCNLNGLSPSTVSVVFTLRGSDSLTEWDVRVLPNQGVVVQRRGSGNKPLKPGHRPVTVRVTKMRLHRIAYDYVLETVVDASPESTMLGTEVDLFAVFVRRESSPTASAQISPLQEFVCVPVSFSEAYPLLLRNRCGFSQDDVDLRGAFSSPTYFV